MYLYTPRNSSAGCALCGKMISSDREKIYDNPEVWMKVRLEKDVSMSLESYLQIESVESGTFTDQGRRSKDALPHVGIP